MKTKIAITSKLICMLFTVTNACTHDANDTISGGCKCEPEDYEITTTDNICPCWGKCIYGQEWNGNECEGEATRVTFEYAMQLCNYLPTISEYDNIFDNCKYDKEVGGAPTFCNSCGASQRCDQFFGNDQRIYWTRDFNDNPYSINYGTGEFKNIDDTDNKLFLRCARLPET